MASMASPNIYFGSSCKTRKSIKSNTGSTRLRILFCQQQDNDNIKPKHQIARREMILKSSEIATLGAIFNFSGKRPEYLGVQKNQQALSLCPATDNCISTSENVSDLTHYVPPWNYNGGRKKPISREEAVEELLQVIREVEPNRFTPKIVERTDDYVHVEYQSPILGLVDDVEFWFRPDNDGIVEYRSASRLGNFDFEYNRKRIKALRLQLEKEGWASVESF